MTVLWGLHSYGVNEVGFALVRVPEARTNHSFNDAFSHLRAYLHPTSLRRPRAIFS